MTQYIIYIYNVNAFMSQLKAVGIDQFLLIIIITILLLIVGQTHIYIYIYMTVIYNIQLQGNVCLFDCYTGSPSLWSFWNDVLVL